MSFNLFDFIANIFKPAAKLIDDVHTSDEERLRLTNALQKLQNQVTLAHVELEKKNIALQSQLLEAQSSIVNTEAKSDSFLTSNWRPITMLVFVLLVVCQAFGLTSLTEEVAKEFLSLVKIGLGGYVISRGVEKTAPKVAEKIMKTVFK